MNELITETITALRKRAPRGWVFKMSDEMGVSVSTIYAYANGTIKNSIDERILLKKLLSNLVEQHEKKVMAELG